MVSGISLISFIASTLVRRTQHFSALYVECCDDLCTGKWYSAIQNSLSTSPFVVEDYRLTADNIPIVRNLITIVFA